MHAKLSDYMQLVAGEPAHWCPGCKTAHRINVRQPSPFNQALWRWNGDTVKPTFRPAIAVPGGCTYSLKDGMITFAPTCVHKLAGRTVPLPRFPEWW